MVEFQEDFSRGELRLYHKLTEKHATQNYWEKMNVAIVALTMSETIGMIEAGIICA